MRAAVCHAERPVLQTRAMTECLPCVEIEPKGEVIGSVVWLHGLGASGHDFEPIVPMLGQPRVRFVFPHAPPMPVTINGGFVMPSWYDITTLDRTPKREHEPDIRRSAQHIEALLAREKDRGLRSDQIVLAGFSQGAAMTLHVGLRHPEPLAGLLVLSGYQLIADTYEAERHEANLATPIFMGHGTHDDMVQVDLGQKARDRLRAAQPNATIDWHEFPIGHEVSVPEVEQVARWFADRWS